MIEVGTILQNRYQVQQQVGAGGMGTVYLATDQRFDSPVAIKETLFTDDDLKKAFEREAHLLNRMRHPALPRVIDYFTEGDVQFLVMEYIAGADLSAILKQTGKFALKDVLRWADELLGALEYLHTQTPPVIHRDIKPQNLKLTTSGEIILLDFGLAKGKTGDTSRLSLTNSVFGYSRSYAPLEQIQGTGTDLRSDIYSLAATLYHLLTGKPPADALMRATAYVNNEIDPLLPVNELNTEIPQSVAEVLMQALELNAGLRLQTATVMREALRRAAHETGIAATMQTAQALHASDDGDATQLSSHRAASSKTSAPLIAAAVAATDPNAPAAPQIQPQIVQQPIGATDDRATTQSAANFAEPVARKSRFPMRRSSSESDGDETSWKSMAGIAAAIVILGGGALAWYATSQQPTAGSQEINQSQNTNQSPTRQPETRPEAAAKTAPNINSAAASAASSPNTVAVSGSSNAAAQTPVSAAQTVETRRAETAGRNNNSSAAAKPNENVADEEEPTEEATAQETPRPAPSPIIVKSAPPTSNSRRDNANKTADDRDSSDDEQTDDPPPKPRRSNTPKPNSDDEAPPGEQGQKG